MAVHRGCQMLEFNLDGLWTSWIEYRNAKQKGTISVRACVRACVCVCVCVCLHFDNCFAQPPFHDLESLFPDSVSEI